MVARGRLGSRTRFGSLHWPPETPAAPSPICLRATRLQDSATSTLGRRGSSAVQAEPRLGLGPGVFEAVKDRRLAELLARLADLWESMESPEDRARLARSVGMMLEIAGEREGTTLRRVVGWLGWRVIDAEAPATRK